MSACAIPAWAEVPFDRPQSKSERQYTPRPLPEGGAKVFVGVPCYGHIHEKALEGLMQSAVPEDGVVAAWSMKHMHQSLLAYCFNGLVCACLNSKAEYGWTHFALHHADIECQPGWINTLAKEMARTGADVMSAVVAIKDHRGVTSTGLRSPSTGCTRRLTMKQVMRLPETFGLEDLPAKGDEVLAVNTGVLMWHLDPWTTDTGEGNTLPYAFTIKDDIVRIPESGLFVPRVCPEDWGFSLWCAARGLKVFATRKVRTMHYGELGFGNDTPWGEWEVEQGDKFGE